MERRYRVGRSCRSEEEEQRVKNKLCANCGNPRPKRRQAYCSDKCTSEYWRKHDWSSLRWSIFDRDGFACIKCGFKVKIDGSYYVVVEDPKKHSRIGEKYIYEPLVADHIISICLGGKEFDAKNVQTLCKWCDKEKTKKDMKKFHNIQASLKTIAYIGTVMNPQWQLTPIAVKTPYNNDPKQSRIIMFFS